MRSSLTEEDYREASSTRMLSDPSRELLRLVWGGGWRLQKLSKPVVLPIERQNILFCMSIAFPPSSSPPPLLVFLSPSHQRQNELVKLSHSEVAVKAWRRKKWEILETRNGNVSRLLPLFSISLAQTFFLRRDKWYRWLFMDLIA